MFKRTYPKDNFYFIQGLTYKYDINTNIRYRGILYSDRLERLGYPFGLMMGLEERGDGSGYLRDYEAMFLKIEVDKPIEDKMREIFGEKTVLNNNQPLRIGGYRWILENKGKKIKFEDKADAYNTIVNLFVDRLEDIDKEEMKKKTYELAKYIQDEMNINTYLQIYIRDNSFFESYRRVAYQVYPPFRDREDIKKILEKIRKKEEISEEEKIALIKVFYKKFKYDTRHTEIYLWFSDERLKEYKNQKFDGSLLNENYIQEGWEKNE